jgi:DNA-binding beta-propeller fold protein YncE
MALAFLLWAYALAQAELSHSNGSSIVGPATTINGAWGLAPSPKTASALSPKAHFAGYLLWLAPAVVAARGNYLYVYDQGRRHIYRYDLARQTVTPFIDYTNGPVGGMAVAADLSLYVVDAGARQVLHIAADGQLLQTLSNEFDLGRPVAVSLDERTGWVWVADSLYNQLVLFNSLGRLISTLKSDDLHSTAALAWGPDGAYIVDRVSRQVVVLGQDGATRYTLGQGTLKMPAGIAVDRFNRVFVIDSFDDSLKIYEQGQLVEVVGSGEASRPFKGLASVWIDHNTLYVADRMNARIVSFRLMSPRVRELPDE